MKSDLSVAKRRRGGSIVHRIIIGVVGMDIEQIALGHSDEFWQLIRERRGQKTVSRAELDKQMAQQ